MKRRSGLQSRPARGRYRCEVGLLVGVPRRPPRAPRSSFSSSRRAFENTSAFNVISVNAARAVYGFACPKIVMMDPPVQLKAEYTSSGRAAGSVEGMERLLAILEQEQGRFDAVA